MAPFVGYRMLESFPLVGYKGERSCLDRDICKPKATGGTYINSFRVLNYNRLQLHLDVVFSLSQTASTVHSPLLSRSLRHFWLLLSCYRISVKAFQVRLICTYFINRIVSEKVLKCVTLRDFEVGLHCCAVYLCNVEVGGKIMNKGKFGWNPQRV